MHQSIPVQVRWLASVVRGCERQAGTSCDSAWPAYNPEVADSNRPALADRARRVGVTATEHLSPTALHVIVAHDLDALEQKVIEADVAS
jgi:hypothetical protein